jgi:hypothetical protein
VPADFCLLCCGNPEKPIHKIEQRAVSRAVSVFARRKRLRRVCGAGQLGHTGRGFYEDAPCHSS